MSDQNSPARPRVGVVGLGAMGLGMARSLRTAGYDVGVHDLRPEVAAAFAREGGAAFDSCGELAAAVDVLVSVVVNAAQTEAVLFGADGAADRLRPGAVFVMCSTVDPNVRSRLSGAWPSRACSTSTPRSPAARPRRPGEMTMMTSGSAEAYAVAEPVLDAMAARSTAWATAPATAARSRSSTSCSPACTSPPPPRRWRSASGRAFPPRRSTRSSRTAPATPGCSRTAWRTCSPATTRRSRRSTSSSRTSASCSTPPGRNVPAAAGRHRAPDVPAGLGGRLGGEDDSAVIKIFPGIDLPKQEEA